MKILVLTAVMAAACGVCAALGAESIPSALELCRAYKSSIQPLNSVSMKVSIDSWTEGEWAHGHAGVTHSQFITRVDGARIEWLGRRTYDDAKGNVESESAIETVFTESQCMRASGKPGGPYRLARIYNSPAKRERIRQMLLEEPKLGGPMDGRVFGEGDNSVADLLIAAEDLSVEAGLKDVNGVACYLVKGTTEYGMVKVWVAPEKGHVAMKYAIEKSAEDRFNDSFVKELNSGVPGSGISRWSTVLDSVDVSEVDGVFIPVSAHLCQTITLDTGRKVEFHYQCKREDIQLSPDFAALGAFQIDLPNGTPVAIDEAPAIRFLWQDGLPVVVVDSSVLDGIDESLARAVEQGKLSSVEPGTELDVPDGVSVDLPETTATTMSSVLPWLTYCVVGTVAIGAVAVFVYRRKKSGR